MALARSAAPRPGFGLLPARRVALGLGAQAAPSLVFVVAGMVLGPQLLNVITVEMLAQFDPVVSVALAVLGVFIGTGYARAGGADKRRWLSGATAQAAVTFSVVGAAMYLLLLQWQPPLPLDAVTMAGVLALCSAASAALGVGPAQSAEVRTASHLADFDDLPIVVLGSVAVPVIAGASSPLAVFLLAIASGLVIGGAGALLFTRSHGAPERGVFVAGTVVLLGGAAAYSSASPLATGCMAGLVWAVAHGAAPSSSLVESDLRKLQHPLVVLLLVVAGASVQFTFALMWLAAPLVLFRLTGKLLGGMAVARALGLRPALVAAILAPPGVLGIAVALNVQQVLTTGDAVVVSVITVAMVASEVLAVVLLPGDEFA